MDWKKNEDMQPHEEEPEPVALYRAVGNVLFIRRWEKNFPFT
ncbi:hypothetical protein ODI_R3041 [Orrella dioscoreae]|uniref:Uncharacterized protein n=1 Tax=Orrella dioscoreae TaxID=1851544 RepID=A0A1C3K395_9BURK|nr:hypothetical protein ODI_01770 [Orrella dioscoreae]SOE50887.1 hypothetical protein ODI_R3041 [Orrella dioscoreae]